MEAEPSRNFRILIVEDSDATLEMMLDDLQKLGYRAEGVTTAEDAIRVLEETPYNLALVDMVLPGKGGLWLIGEIQRHFPSVICVLMTGNQSVQSGVEAAELGAKGYLIKPLRSKELQIAIERARKIYDIELERQKKQVEIAKELKRLSDKAQDLASEAPDESGKSE